MLEPFLYEMEAALRAGIAPAAAGPRGTSTRSRQWRIAAEIADEVARARLRQMREFSLRTV